MQTNTGKATGRLTRPVTIPSMRYDPEAGAVYVRVRKGKVAGVKTYRDDLIIDFDKDGNIIGIEYIGVEP